MAKNVDWEQIERDYRAGVKTLRQIADEHSISHGAINKRAKRDGWERDLSAKIAAKAEALVSSKAVSKEVSKEDLATEREIVESNAQAIADAVLNQRADVKRGRGVVQKLFAEVETQLDGLEDFERLGELMFAPDENGTDRLHQLYQKVISLPSRVDSAKKLADALRVLIELERKVLRIKDDSTLDDFAKKVGEGAAMSALDAYSQMCGD